MAVCFNSFVGFNTSSNKCRQVPGCITFFLSPVQLKLVAEGRRSKICLSVSSNDNLAGETTLQESKTKEESYSNDLSSSSQDESFLPNENLGSEPPQASETSNGSAKPSPTTLKRAPLTARERLRAARVLSRYTTESTKPSAPKIGLGSKLPDLLQGTEKERKRSGLPEAPSDLLDDSNRGLSKQGWSINIIPGGMDVFLIIFSFVFISTVMFATTYIVWKVGAIHFNEY